MVFYSSVITVMHGPIDIKYTTGHSGFFAATLHIYPGTVPCIPTLTIWNAVTLIHSRGRSRSDNRGPLQWLTKLLSVLTRGIHNIAFCRKKVIWSEKKTPIQNSVTCVYVWGLLTWVTRASGSAVPLSTSLVPCCGDNGPLILNTRKINTKNSFTSEFASAMNHSSTHQDPTCVVYHRTN